MTDRLLSVAHAQRLARARLPSPLYDYVTRGSERELAADANVQAFESWKCPTRIRSDTVSKPDTGTSLVGTSASIPLALAPAGFLGLLWPNGEIAAANAARDRGIPMAVSTLASSSISTLTATGAACWYQLYRAGGPAAADAAVDRAAEAGCSVLVLTTDFVAPPAADTQDAPFLVPDRINTATLLRYGVAALRRPRWLASVARQHSTLAAPNVIEPGSAKPMTIGEAARSVLDWPIGWDEIAWYRARWNGRLVVKGVQTPRDARRAFDLGADSVIVSNHGGRGLGAAPATLDLLEAVVDAVGPQGEVLIDGGVRRGSDVAAALSLGARGVLAGRAYVWALAAAGERGVTDIIDVIASGLRTTMIARDVAHVADMRGTSALGHGLGR